MQGWFAFGYYFLPSPWIAPVFIGTHFTHPTQEFLRFFLACYPRYFAHTQVGCRDFFTLNFCQTHHIESYFSRCLTLTLPKRQSQPKTQTKVFIVNVPQEFLRYIPSHLRENAEYINQRGVLHKPYWQEDYQSTQTLLNRYALEARIIITTALHCASPCTAMGIPVVLLQDHPEQSTRFSALHNILKPYTLEDLRCNRVDFAPKAPEIEDLKEAMLINLELSIRQTWGEAINTAALSRAREYIAQACYL